MRRFRSDGWRFWFDGFEFGIMGVVTIDAKEIGPFPPLEKADSFPVNPGLPVAVDIPMALPAKPVGFGEIHGLAVGKLQFVAIAGAVTIETPSFLFRMPQFDGGMFVLQFPFLGVDFKPGVTIAAGKDSLGEGRRGNGIVIMLSCRSRETESDCDERYKKQYNLHRLRLSIFC